MANVKWIKLVVGMFDNAKIKYIRTLPEGNDLVLIWVMLLTKAGHCNSNGYIFLTENIPYTPDMLAAEFGFNINTIKLALTTFNNLNMIQLEKQTIVINNWEEYQNVEGLDKIRQQTRERVAKYREKQKALPCNVTVTEGNAIEEELDIEEDKEREKEREKDTKVSEEAVKAVVTKWNNIEGIPRIEKLTQQRIKKLGVRIRESGLETVLSAIDNIQYSTFLKGDNPRGWTIDFSWFLEPEPFVKVLEGKYTNNKLLKKENEPEILF